VAEPFTVPMRHVWGELQKLKLRLREILDCKRQQVSKVSSASKRARRRRQIVDALQAKLRLRTREDLADHLRVDNSAIRAAIRGDRERSGPAAEKKIID